MTNPFIHASRPPRYDRLATWALGLLVCPYLLSCASSSSGQTPIIYVSPTGSDSASGTLPTEPLASLQLAVMRAAACEPEMCVVHAAGGEYLGAVTLIGGVDVRGGYLADFSARDLKAQETVVTSDEWRTVIADGLQAPVTLDGVHVVGADFSGGFGSETSNGVWVRNSGDFLRIVNATVSAGAGADGNDGGVGDMRACEARGGAGGEAYDCGSNGGGVGQADGDVAMGGEGGGGGGSNCPNACPLVGGDGISDGQVGTDGLPGEDGGSGDTGFDNRGRIVTGAWVGYQGTGGQRGQNGTGGGGGGSGGSKRFRACFGCDTLFGGRGGDGGVGGCGGGGGQPGAPGGGSLAMIVIDATVVLNNVTIRGGEGGRGGRGGDGHAGTLGGSDGSVGQQGRASQQCGLINYSAGGGGVGGLGGEGGHGGGGGGGVGGLAAGIALVGVAEYVEGDDVIIEAGAAGRGGFGGFGGAQNGANGLEGASMPVMTFLPDS